MTTLDPHIDSQRSQEEELAQLRAEVAAWRERFAASSTRDLAFVNSGGDVAPLPSRPARYEAATPSLGSRRADEFRGARLEPVAPGAGA